MSLGFWLFWTFGFSETPELLVVLVKTWNTHVMKTLGWRKPLQNPMFVLNLRWYNLVNNPCKQLWVLWIERILTKPRSCKGVQVFMRTWKTQVFFDFWRKPNVFLEIEVEFFLNNSGFSNSLSPWQVFEKVQWKKP